MSEPKSPFEQRLIELGWATWAMGLVASTSLTGFLAQLVDLPGKAGLGDAALFVVAAFGGLALTLGTAFAYRVLHTGEYQGWPAVLVATLCVGAGILVSNVIGIAAVGTDAINEANLTTSAPGPLDPLAALIFACVLVYGPVASLQAAIAGLLLGYWATLFE